MFLTLIVSQEASENPQSLKRCLIGNLEGSYHSLGLAQLPMARAEERDSRKTSPKCGKDWAGAFEVLLAEYGLALSFAPLHE